MRSPKKADFKPGTTLYNRFGMWILIASHHLGTWLAQGLDGEETILESAALMYDID